MKKHIITIILLWHFFGATNERMKLETRYAKIMSHCLEKNYKELRPVFKKNTFFNYKTRDKITYLFVKNMAYKFFIPLLHGFKEGLCSAHTALFYPENEHYWLEYLAMSYYNNLKNTLIHKAKREKLDEFRRACLAVCVSSKLLDERKEIGLPKSYQEAVQDQEGVCVEFAAVADDIAKSLGLNSKTVDGSYKKWNEKLKDFIIGEHTMLQINVANKKYFIETTSPGCVFWNTEITP